MRKKKLHENFPIYSSPKANLCYLMECLSYESCAKEPRAISLGLLIADFFPILYILYSSPDCIFQWGRENMKFNFGV